MSVCVFFGHRHLYENIAPQLETVLIDLIENHGVTTFYVGNQGSFDSLVYKTLEGLSNRYQITFAIVLAYMPGAKDEYYQEKNTILPEGIETVPRRFAISWRNRWLVEQADYVVTYVRSHIGSGAAQFKELAERKEKYVINLE